MFCSCIKFLQYGWSVVMTTVGYSFAQNHWVNELLIASESLSMGAVLNMLSEGSKLKLSFDVLYGYLF